MAAKTPGYVVDKDGKIIPMPWNDSLQTRVSIQNKAIKDAGFQNVNFSDSGWASMIEKEGGKVFSEGQKSDAEKLSKEIANKAAAQTKPKEDAEKTKIQEAKFTSLADEIMKLAGGKTVGNREDIDAAKKSVSDIDKQIEKLKTPNNEFDADYVGQRNKVGKYYANKADYQHPYNDAKNWYNDYKPGGRFNPNGDFVPINAWQENEKSGANATRIKQLEELKAGSEKQLKNLSTIVKKDSSQGEISKSLQSLSADRNYKASDLGAKLNYQVSDQDIVNDYNKYKISGYSDIINRGNAQIAGIQERLTTANSLLAELPKNDSNRKSSEAYVKQLSDDLNSVRTAVSEATTLKKNFVPIDTASQQGAKEITSLRSFIQLPEERATQQLRQIDPDSYRTAVGLGQQYRQMATQPIGATTTPETEQIRQTIEDEALNQLRLGSTIGAEERRGYEQSIRAAQTARGNVFGLGPAVQEASQIGAAGEARKLARYGAAQSFLGSGQTTGDALKADIAFRDALRQNRLGAAANFIGGGPSIANLAAQRTGQQQSAMQSYIQANQALPGGFNQQPSTAANFYQATNPEIPVQLQNAFTNLYGSQANYLSSTYGAQVGAISRQPSGFQNFATLAGGVKDLAGGFGALAGAGVFCWVAREVYGIDNPKWLQFREWMLTKASDNLRNYYIEYGERIAESIRNKPRIKDLIRKWMDSKIG